jgi:hypothetical protein
VVLQHRGRLEEVRQMANRIHGARDAAHRGEEVSAVVASTLEWWPLLGDLDRTIGKEGVGRGASRRVGRANGGGGKKGGHGNDPACF